MAGFGILYASYFIVILLEVWFVFRVDIIETAARSPRAETSLLLAPRPRRL